MGVSRSQQRGGLGSQLYREIERRMHEEGVRMAFVDTARSNTGAIKFFKRMGYGKPEAEVWMRKMLQRTRKAKNDQESSPPRRRRASVSAPSRVTSFPVLTRPPKFSRRFRAALQSHPDPILDRSHRRTPPRRKSLRAHSDTPWRRTRAASPALRASMPQRRRQ